MDCYTCAFLFLIGSLIYVYFKKKMGYFKEFGVPYLSGWPILGIFGDCILRRKHITEVLQELYNLNADAKYVGSFSTFGAPVFVLKDLELIKSVAIKNFDSFPEHPPLNDVSREPLFGGNLFNLNGQKWRDSRTELTPLFTPSKMKMMYGLMEECAKSFVDFIDEQPSEYLKMVETKDLFVRYTNDVIASCAFGIKIDSLKDKNNKFFVLGNEGTRGDIVSIKVGIARLFPGLIKALRIRVFSQELGDFFTSVIRNTMKMRDEKGISRPDLLQLMMEQRNQDTEQEDVENITCQAFVFFLAGFITTSSSICALAHELALNPDIQRELQAEIDQVMEETNGQPTYEAIKRMQLLDATIYEVMRLHGQSPYIDRICRKAFELPPALPGCKPVTVQPDTLLLIPSAPIHRDPKYYDNPNQFDPSRYYGKKITTSDTTTLAFGIGPRSCIGKRFVLLETEVLLFHLLAKYTFEANEKTCNPFKYSKKNFYAEAEGGFWLAIKRRGKVVAHK